MKAVDKILSSGFSDFGFEEPTRVASSYLFLGNYISSIDVEKLRSLGINNILNVASREIDDDVSILMASAKSSLPFKVKKLHVDDNETSDLLSIIVEAVYFIDKVRKENEKVLVHCSQGQSRSLSIVLAYIMLVYRKPFEKCLGNLRKRRPCVLPNDGFVRQLLFLESLINTHGSHAVTYIRHRGSSEFERSPFAKPKGLAGRYSLIGVSEYDWQANVSTADRQYISTLLNPLKFK
ncbi:hypothetical protein ACOME3_007738 [Neoechinorhynchus agilis]